MAHTATITLASTQNSATNVTTHKNTLTLRVTTTAKIRRIVQAIGESNSSKAKK